MFFEVLDINNPSKEFHSRFHVVLSANCIHATHILRHSCTNLRSMLGNHGFVALVEATYKLPWFDLVFGLLDKWWSFSDERSHALTSAYAWSGILQDVGFLQIQYSSNTSKDPDGINIICGLNIHPSELSNQRKTNPRASALLIQGTQNSSNSVIFAIPGGFGTAATYTSLPPLTQISLFTD